MVVARCFRIADLTSALVADRVSVLSSKRTLPSGFCLHIRSALELELLLDTFSLKV